MQFFFLNLAVFSAISSVFSLPTLNVPGGLDKRASLGPPRSLSDSGTLEDAKEGDIHSVLFMGARHKSQYQPAVVVGVEKEGQHVVLTFLPFYTSNSKSKGTIDLHSIDPRLVIEGMKDPWDGPYRYISSPMKKILRDSWRVGTRLKVEYTNELLGILKKYVEKEKYTVIPAGEIDNSIPPPWYSQPRKNDGPSSSQVSPGVGVSERPSVSYPGLYPPPPGPPPQFNSRPPGESMSVASWRSTPGGPVAMAASLPPSVPSSHHPALSGVFPSSFRVPTDSGAGVGHGPGQSHTDYPPKDTRVSQETTRASRVRGFQDNFSPYSRPSGSRKRHPSSSRVAIGGGTSTSHHGPPVLLGPPPFASIEGSMSVEDLGPHLTSWNDNTGARQTGPVAMAGPPSSHYPPSPSNSNVGGARVPLGYGPSDHRNSLNHPLAMEALPNVASSHYPAAGASDVGIQVPMDGSATGVPNNINIPKGYVPGPPTSLPTGW